MLLEPLRLKPLMDVKSDVAPFVLVVGDGDLSFSAALCAGGSVPACRLVASTLDSADVLRKLYARAGENIQLLLQAGAFVFHGVDAMRLQNTLRLQVPEDLASPALLFTRIIFNFPHGVGGIKKQRALILNFLNSAATLLSPGGTVEVTLCGGQGGTPGDGIHMRSWPDTWHAALLGAQAGFVLSAVTPWHPPSGYAPRREVGNSDEYGERTFGVRGGCVHVFSRRQCVVVGPGAGLRSTSVCADQTMPRAGFFHHKRLLAAQMSLENAFAAEQLLLKMDGFLPVTYPSFRHFEEVVCGHWGCQRMYGPRYPRSAHILCARVQDLQPGDLPRWESTLENALRAASSTKLYQWQWTQDTPSRRCFEVFVERTLRTPCFVVDESLAHLGDWLVLLESALENDVDATFRVDMDVLAMLQGDVGDRRLLKEPMSYPMTRPNVCDESTFNGASNDFDDPIQHPSSLYPCLFIHDLRIREDAGLDEVALIDLILELCGNVLVEAYELPKVTVASGQRHWRLALSSPGDVLDDRTAYRIYQMVREAVRDRLNVELC